MPEAQNNPTVEKWLCEWLDVYYSRKAPNTQAFYKHVIIRHITPRIGGIPIGSLKKTDCQKLLNQLSAAGLTETVGKAATILRLSMDAAVADGLLLTNPALRLSAPSFHRQARRALSPWEKRVVDMTPLDPMERMFVELLRYTGMRRGEALALLRGGVDMEKRVIAVSRTLIRCEGRSVLQPFTKTETGRREIPVLDALYGVLDAYLNGAPDSFLFTYGGDPLSGSQIIRFCGNITRKIHHEAAREGLEMLPVTPHIFRHTFATDLYLSGVDVKTAQSILGHASVSTTLDVYTHLSGSSQENLEKLNAFYRGRAILTTS